MTPLIPKPRKPWQDDPGHIHDSPGPPPTEGQPPVEQDDLGPGGVSAPAEPRGVGETIQPEVEPSFPADERDPAPVPDINELDVPKELEDQIRASMAKYPQVRSASIPALWAVQRMYGWCSPDGMRQAAAVMGVTPGYLQSVATFYDLFHTEPTGQHEVLVCTNISCWLRGADDILGEFLDEMVADDTGGPGREAEEPPVMSVRGFECLGACDIAPMASVDERYFGPLEPGDAGTIAGQLASGEDVLPAKRLEDRKTAGKPG